MARRRKRWLAFIGLAAGLGLLVLFVSGYVLARRFDPYIRQEAIRYLQQRFDSEVELASLRIRVPQMSPLKVAFNRGRGIRIHVEGEGLKLRHKGRTDVPPMFVMNHFASEVELDTLFETRKTIHSVTIDGLELNIPPKGSRPDFDDGPEDVIGDTDVVVEEVIVRDSVLKILPRDKSKVPLHFALHHVRLESAARNAAMRYDASLTNAKPPGEIRSVGSFGPWDAGEPGDTPLSGEYTFDDADLGVFKGIAGILDSNGKFEGTLSSIEVQGEATVPDFRLKMSGHKVPLSTRFEVLVDGTNGDTILKPVNGTLGKTSFTTSGGVIKHEAESRRTIALDVTMPKGRLRDILTLAMKGAPFMEGTIALKTRIDIPPLSGKIREKLRLDGQFEIFNGLFLKSTIQEKIDSLSRRGQGKPKDEEIDQVVSGMGGRFHMDDEVITFDALSFGVPGAGIDLSGAYNLDRDVLDFHGSLKLDAKVSQTMTGWKRWVLKPVDPFFSKNGAGTFLKIKVDGSSKNPKFGLDKKKDL